MKLDELIRSLEERRAGLVGQMETILAKPTEEKRELSAEEQTTFDSTQTEIRGLDAQLTKFREQRDAEARAAAARAGDPQTVDNGQGGQAGTVKVLNEPTTYNKYSQKSYFLDLARWQLRNDSAAYERLTRHAQEIDVLMPERRKAAARRAEKRAYETFGEEAYARSGVNPFEKRFISRTDGQGGYFVPPLWLPDEYIPYLRAGRVMADMWTSLPLPAGTDSINIPRVVLGTASGPQPADGAPLPGRDIQDNFINALVRTVAGQQDAAIQLLDQSPVAFDQIIFKDIMADLAMNLSGQLIVGSGTNGQLTGLYPQGTINGGSTPGFLVNNNGNAWTAAAGTANFYASMAQLVSQISRKRFRPPTGIVTNPAVWYAMASAVDSQNRPLVMPSQQGLGYNAAAGDDDGPVTEGPVGHILGIPWTVDPNIPLTFGGTTAPSIAAISQGNVAPVDGSGGNPVYTPSLAAVWDDLYLWEGELRTRTLSEVLSGTLQVRFQCYGYCASMPNRYQDSTGKYLSYGNYNTVGTTGSVLSTSGLLASF